MVRARSELRRVFGFSEFRPLQEQIVANVLYGNDTLGVMPTGAGKSLCYQIPSLTFDRLTVVISPLLSLMQDQIDQLRAAGVFAVTLNSLISYAEYTENIRQIRAGRAKLLYLAPETLLRPEILALLDESSVALLTIDEAHCISEWGHDFRPEYRQLRVIRKRYPNATCLALTATATERVREDIRTSLGIDPGNTFISGFDRPNLYLEVQRRAPTLTQLKRFLAAHRGQPGIIYCSTRKQVEQLAEQLSTAGIDALPYHAGMADAARRENQRRFQRDDVQIIVATIAFGMGINKSNVRFVVHCTLPE
jgi:ATP-dependent DNA helicase, RecQ family